jgi:RND family efflux transporter MFP subunit
VALGDEATVDLGALPQPVKGTVGEIVPAVDVASRAFLVKIDLPAEVSSLRPGMFARVAFKVGNRPRLVVAASAVTRSGALDRVYVIDGDRARLRMITVGETQGPWIEVLSGLTADEHVVAAPTPALHDGAPVVEAR